VEAEHTKTEAARQQWLRNWLPRSQAAGQ